MSLCVYLFKLEGRGLTSNTDNVYSVFHFEHEGEIFLFASGSAGNVDIFRLSDFGEGDFTSESLFPAFYYVVVCVPFLIPRPFQNSQAAGIGESCTSLSSSRGLRFRHGVSSMYIFLSLSHSFLYSAYNKLGKSVGVWEIHFLGL